MTENRDSVVPTDMEALYGIQATRGYLERLKGPRDAAEKEEKAINGI